MDERERIKDVKRTRRETLCPGNGKKEIDMEKVYRQLDSGRSVKSVAREWGVAVSTLYRKHHEYQKEIEAVCGAEGEEFPPLPFPPLPEDLLE